MLLTEKLRARMRDGLERREVWISFEIIIIIRVYGRFVTKSTEINFSRGVVFMVQINTNDIFFVVVIGGDFFFAIDFFYFCVTKGTR